MIVFSSVPGVRCCHPTEKTTTVPGDSPVAPTCSHTRRSGLSRLPDCPAGHAVQRGATPGDRRRGNLRPRHCCRLPFPQFRGLPARIVYPVDSRGAPRPISAAISSLFRQALTFQAHLTFLGSCALIRPARPTQRLTLSLVVHGGPLRIPADTLVN